mgnify:CR=1 FL=1
MTNDTKEKKATKAKKKTVVETPSLEEMLTAGVHFGHKPSKWHPKMAEYIFGVRNNIHIIDLEKTQAKLEEALRFIQTIKDKKGTILFVGTKTIAKDIIKDAAQKTKMPYVTNRWLGGTLTNFNNISKRLKYFRDLEDKKTKGELEKYTKKEKLDIDRELNKLDIRFGGIKNMEKLPDAIFVIDAHQEKIAIQEARHKDIPVIAQTAYAMPEEKNKSIEAGCNLYITKPITPDKLLPAINNLLY